MTLPPSDAAILIGLLACLLPGLAGAGDARPQAYVVVDGAAIPAPFIGAAPEDEIGGPAGDAGRGHAQAQRLCAQCHALPDSPSPEADAVGPPLTGVADRMSPGALRLAVVNLAIRSPATEGHAFYDVPAFEAAAVAPVETALTAQEVEDIVAWLTTLTR